MTTVYVTHDQREALTMSDRIAVINHGPFDAIGHAASHLRPPGERRRRFYRWSTFLPDPARR